MKIVAFLLVVGAAIALALGAAQHMKRDDHLAALRDTVRITDSVRTVVAETVKVKLAAKLHMDTVVQVVTDTQLVLQSTPAAKPETVTVAPLIVERIASCDAFASSCRLQLAADSAVIRSQAALIAAVKPKRFSLSVTIGPSCNQRDCDLRITFGPSFRVR